MLLILMILGTLLTISSTNWLSIWLGFEINMIGFIPFLLTFSPQSVEGAVKYLLIQASGSGLLLMSGLMSWLSTGAMSLILAKDMSNVILIISLLLKMGIFPFFFWVPSVMNSTSWVSGLILITWQKVAPLALLSSLNLSGSQLQLITVMSVSSILVGGLLGINQTQLRALMAYSSIAHGGWMVLLSALSMSSLKLYFILYSIISSGLLWSLSKTYQSLLTQTKTLDCKSSMDYLSISMSLLSLGGMPPLTGFFAKVVAIREILDTGMVWLLTLIILGTLMSLSYYLTVLFSFMVSYSPLGILYKKASFSSTLFLVFNTTGFIVISIGLSLM
uniref:NADH-ubiquinone oxidoreductase chain 2 n=1 Tax=Pectinatella magnifica TaxID=350071 RepID=A0A344AUW8_9BILA|nr:NADH dehydrogenase subunit 2 [Pectinatella magnifica]AWX65965.1 NADH dehydrogenase subunit 2 [Pectinatella magnifica]